MLNTSRSAPAPDVAGEDHVRHVAPARSRPSLHTGTPLRICPSTSASVHPNADRARLMLVIPPLATTKPGRCRMPATTAQRPDMIARPVARKSDESRRARVVYTRAPVPRARLPTLRSTALAASCPRVRPENEQGNRGLHRRHPPCRGQPFHLLGGTGNPGAGHNEPGLEPRPDFRPGQKLTVVDSPANFHERSARAVDEDLPPPLRGQNAECQDHRGPRRQAAFASDRDAAAGLFQDFTNAVRSAAADVAE